MRPLFEELLFPDDFVGLGRPDTRAAVRAAAWTWGLSVPVGFCDRCALWSAVQLDAFVIAEEYGSVMIPALAGFCRE